jgi:competence protein ComFC
MDFLLHRQCKKGNLLQSLEKIILLAHYKDSYIARLIKDAKYYHKKDILEDMGKYLAEQFAKYEEIKEKESYIITAPPMYFLKKWKRSYNHSEILWKHIANILWIEAYFKLLKKTKYTKQQSRLSQKDREKNILSSFVFNEKAREKIIGKTIIIVDDVISTWATISEMAHILQKNWAKKIIALIIASD